MRNGKVKLKQRRRRPAQHDDWSLLIATAALALLLIILLTGCARLQPWSEAWDERPRLEKNANGYEVRGEYGMRVPEVRP